MPHIKTRKIERFFAELKRRYVILDKLEDLELKDLLNLGILYLSQHETLLQTSPNYSQRLAIIKILKKGYSENLQGNSLYEQFVIETLSPLADELRAFFNHNVKHR